LNLSLFSFDIRDEMSVPDRPSRTQDEWIALRCQAGDNTGFEDLVALIRRQADRECANGVRRPAKLLSKPTILEFIGSLNTSGLSFLIQNKCEAKIHLLRPR
jgi:hypothetical protein